MQPTLAIAQPLSGMSADSPIDDRKRPMPCAWTRTYPGSSGKAGRVFTRTHGVFGDLANDGFRRMLVNACFWAAGPEREIMPDADAAK